MKDEKARNFFSLNIWWSSNMFTEMGVTPENLITKCPLSKLGNSNLFGVNFSARSFIASLDFRFRSFLWAISFQNVLLFYISDPQIRKNVLKLSYCKIQNVCYILVIPTVDCWQSCTHVILIRNTHVWPKFWRRKTI